MGEGRDTAAGKPRLSIIVPGRNAAETLTRALAALRRASPPDMRTEIVYVDDGSEDGSVALAEAIADRVVCLPPPAQGPACARNRGVALARGDLLGFVDADVAVHPDAVTRMVRRLSDDPGLAAVFGSYDDTPSEPGLVSQYRNLLHHYVHQRSRSEAATFWSGCGMLRRAAWDRVGGFRDEMRAIEDIDLGRRMHRACLRIRLDPDVQACHMKRWTLRNMVRTDICGRGIPWMRLLLCDRLRSREMGDLNLTWSARLSAPLAWLALAATATAFVAGAAAVAAAVLWLLLVWLHRDLYVFFERKRGWRFAAATAPLQALYHLGNGVAAAFALIEFSLQRMLRPGLPRPGNS